MRGQWSQHEARGVLAAWRQRELSIEKFGKERATTPQRIRWWKKKLDGAIDEASKKPGSMALPPVSLVAPVATPKRGELTVCLRGGQPWKSHIGRSHFSPTFASGFSIVGRWC